MHAGLRESEPVFVRHEDGYPEWRAAELPVEVETSGSG
jgi:hypothetical protein